ncbi:MAG: hypothetical protein FGM24_07030 [Candidatus Kapabacteria bacterium]|nr:hypothetical protein [Candidatus Kapabacteria bacterium]
MRTALRSGWGASVKLAIGAGLFDVLYCMLAMLATSAASRLIGAASTAYPGASIAVQLMIVLAMVAFGITQMRQPPLPPQSRDDDAPTDTGWVARIRSHGPFFVGVGFAIANLANPTFLPALAALSTFMQHSGWYATTVWNAVAFSVMFGIGQASWLLTLVRLLLRHRDRMTPTFVKRLQQAAGLVLIAFGTVYAVRILTDTEWSTVLRAAVSR